MNTREIIATVRVGHSNRSEAASLYLVRASERTYCVYLFSVSDDKKYDVLFTESRDDAVKAFQSAAGILINHGKDYLLDILKSTEGLCMGES